MASVNPIAKKQGWHSRFSDSENPALGFVELSSISRGLFLTDALLKKAPVRLLCSQPVSSGKHVLLYFGDVASVEESHREVLEKSDGTALQDVLIPAVHPDLVPYLDSLWGEGKDSVVLESVGIAESKTLAATILAADRALKAADVSLCRMRLGQGIGGRGYFVITGEQDDVEASLRASQDTLEALDSFLRVDLIPRPQEEAVHFF